MARNAQRLSQLVSTFGPGSMIDLPTRSVVVGGLERWTMAPGSFESISEERLTSRLEQLLREQGRLAEGVRLSLRTPPRMGDARTGLPSGVDAPVFPQWFVCETAEAEGATDGGKGIRRRRLVRWRDLDSKGHRQFEADGGGKSGVTPIRFVCACDDGHLDDVDWRWVVHGASGACSEPMWIEERGTSADPADTSVVCGCKRRLSLQDLFQPGRLGKCQGRRPWLVDRELDGCGADLKLLIRTATNTYFTQVYTVISLPAEDDALSKLVSELSAELTKVSAAEHITQAKMFNPRVEAALRSYGDAEIFERLMRLREAAQLEHGRPPQLAEFDVFTSGRAEIGYNGPDAKLYAQTLPDAMWRDPSAGIDLTSIEGVVAVHRLREVSCLYGFTRFEAAPTVTDGDFEDIQLAVRGAPISQGADWLPAVEQFGEGIFIHFNAQRLAAWLDRPQVMARQVTLLAGYNHWRKRFTGKPPSFPGTPYVLLHSISHVLMGEIALDCGYPASSLKERVYAMQGTTGSGYDRCGILIYAAAQGAQGTLGGLVGVAPRLAHLFRSALERVSICSNDPVCADHEPDGRSGDRATHGAACHSCLLISETSCERRNLFLDRNLLASTMSMTMSGLFG